MTAYPPQPPVRKLTRSRTNKMLGGVCAGVATYLNMDVTLVRVLTVVLALFTGIPVVAYIVCLLVVPEEDLPPYAGPPNAPTPATGAPADPVWGAGGAPWDPSSGPAPTPPTTPPPTPTAEPGPAPAPPPVPNEAAPVTDPEPVPETPLPEATPGEQSTWESTPADAEQSDPPEANDKPAT